jgi:hypothetical protein
VLGESVDPINGVDLGDGRLAGDADVSLGPLSMSSDNAWTNCSNVATGALVWATCTSSLENLSVSLGGIVILTADSMVAQSTSTNDGSMTWSEHTGSQFGGLCIVLTSGAACTPVTSPGTYLIDIEGVGHGTITVQPEDPSAIESGATGSGLTVTMLHIDFQTVAGGVINLDIGQAHTFVSDQAVGTATPLPTPLPTESPLLSPPPAPTATPIPTAAQLPTTGGPGAGSDSSSGWYIALAGLALAGGIVFTLLGLPRGSLAGNGPGTAASKPRLYRRKGKRAKP